jgi:transcriptional regulator with XRE-family HTH domain
MKGQQQFNERLRIALKQAGMTQLELSKATGTSTQTVGSWVSGRMEPRPRRIADIAEALDVDKGWLLTGAKGLDEAAILDELRQIRAGQEEILSAVEEVRRNQEAVPTE